MNRPRPFSAAQPSTIQPPRYERDHCRGICPTIAAAIDTSSTSAVSRDEWTVGDFHDFVKVSVDAPPFPPSCVSIKSTQGFRLVDRSARKDREIFDSFSIEERKIEESLDSSFS